MIQEVQKLIKAFDQLGYVVEEELATVLPKRPRVDDSRIVSM